MYHPDNENGSVEVTQEINTEYDNVIDVLKGHRKKCGVCKKIEKECIAYTVANMRRNVDNRNF